MEIVGRVVQLWRYPLKSALGERLETLSFDAFGAEADRGWAAREVETGRVLSGKRFASLLSIRARVRDGEVVLTFPDGAEHGVSTPEAADAVSEIAGVSVTLGQAVAGEAPTILGEGNEFEGPPGTFFDSAPVHLITTASLRAFGEPATFDPRRFRPNIVLGTRKDGFVEQDWVGSTLRAGSAEFRVRKGCTRCVLTTHAQEELDQDRSVLATVREKADGIAGILLEVVTPGTARIGEPVEIAAS